MHLLSSKNENLKRKLEIFSENAKITKWIPNASNAPVIQLPVSKKAKRKIPIDGKVRIKASVVLTQNVFTSTS